ncbi:FAD-dependent oxidoreductase [Streptomyces phaeochromogenes]|uniref:FAD-dependent oxidoreductase n=1 Tax=Streptomyces phaeochromogenes TaxID=1923 RepID=UPI0033EE2351
MQRRIDQREWCAHPHGGALTACSTAAKKGSSAGGASDDLDVVVIGAGIAGLAAGPEGLVFTALIEGEETARALALSRERRRAEVLDVIRSTVGDRELQPVRVHEHKWFKDPFARAPHSKYGIPGEDLIYEPTGGSVHWAGIITESVDTSRDSGEEVAGEVLQRLGRK